MSMTAPTTSDVAAAWDAAWAAFAKSAHEYAAEVQENWAKYAGEVEKTLHYLFGVRPVLEKLPGLIADYEKAGGKPEYVAVYRQNYNALVRTYNALTAGIWEGAQSAPPPPIQLGMAWFVVAGVTLSILGVCFAIPAYKYASALYEQAHAQEVEITGRIEAMRKGATLQESTYQAPPSDPPKDDFSLAGLLLLLAAGGGVAAAIYAKRGT